MFYSNIFTTFVLLSLAAVNGGRVSQRQTAGMFAENNTTTMTDDGFGGMTNVTDYNLTEVLDRGDPDSFAAYQSNDTVVLDDSDSVSIMGASGSGQGSCVYGRSTNYPSLLDLPGKKGVFFARVDEGLSCTFVNKHFSGYVCPCESVCSHYQTVTAFLDDFCERTLKGSDNGQNQCKKYLWSCCGFPYYCGSGFYR